MGHYGKHIIDPETGLCEICDNGAIHEVRQSKRPGKQVFYSNHDDKSTYGSNNDEIPNVKDRYVYETNDEPTPRHIRKSVYPAPTVRQRRVVNEVPVEIPVFVRRKTVRRDHTPPEEAVVHRPLPRPTKFYYVDKEGQMLPQDDTPPPGPRTRYVVQSRHPPPQRTVRVIRRRAQTPPSSVTEAWHSRPRRQIKSDTEIIERQQRMRRDDAYYPQTTQRKPEMYHIETIPSHHRRRSLLESPIHRSYDNNSPPPKVIYQVDDDRKQRKLEPMERQIRHEPEPAVVRRVYKKLPPGKHELPDDEYVANENHPRPMPKNDKNRFPVRQYASSPQLTDRNNRSPEPAKNPSIYYIRSVDDYQ